MKIGQTIVSERERAVSESERMETRRKEEKRKKISIMMFFAGLTLIIVVVSGLAMNAVVERKKNELPNQNEKKYQPKVEIVDAAGAGYITDKIKTTVGMLEEDFLNLGYRVSKAIVPANTAREIDIFLEGVEPFFKIHVDRNTAESAEDAVRMIKHLSKQQKKAIYVDVRIAGRAYYKGQ